MLYCFQFRFYTTKTSSAIKFTNTIEQLNRVLRTEPSTMINLLLADTLDCTYNLWTETWLWIGCSEYKSPAGMFKSYIQHLIKNSCLYGSTYSNAATSRLLIWYNSFSSEIRCILRQHFGKETVIVTRWHHHSPTEAVQKTDDIVKMFWYCTSVKSRVSTFFS